MPDLQPMLFWPFSEKCCLKKEKLQGIGTDNASVMTGI